jgi:hypothetical protein
MACLYRAEAALIGGGQVDAQATVIHVASSIIAGGQASAMPANDSAPTPAPPLEADAKAIAMFVTTMFKHASPGAYIHFRGFDEQNAAARPTVFTHAIIPPDGNLQQIAAQAAQLATYAARFEPPSNFAPPVATFRDSRKGGEEYLAEGLTLMADLDESPEAGEHKLIELLGVPTVAVGTGGYYADPATGAQAKRHLYWRLSTPTRTPQEHALLKHANDLACALVGGDRSAITPVHPMRWPGSWHRKDPDNPRYARIRRCCPDIEIELRKVVAILEQACSDAGVDVRPTVARSAEHFDDGPRVVDWSIEDVEAWMRDIPNPDLKWPDWKNMLLRIYAKAVPAKGGGIDEGRRIAHIWSKKSSEKYTEKGTNKAWDDIVRSPPTITHGEMLLELAFTEVERREADAERQRRLEKQGDEQRHGGDEHHDNQNHTDKQQQQIDNRQQANPDDLPLIDILAGEEAVPPFPVQVLPPPFGLWVEDVADRMQVPVDFVAIPLLVMAATMLGKDCKIHPKSHDDWTERPCLWGLIIGPTGVKKSPSMREALRPIRRIQKDMMEQYKREYAAWGQRQDKRKKDETDVPPVPERCLTNEATVEALATLMSEEHNGNPRGLLFYRDELSGWIESFNKYRGGKGDDTEFFLQCYSGGPFHVDRKDPGRSLYVQDTYLNIVGTTQPGVLDKILKDERIRGLAARFQLAVWPQLLPRIDMVDRRPNIEARRAVEDRLRDTRSIYDNGEIRFSRPAYALYNKWWLKNANRAERAEDSPFAGHLAKYEGTFPQLALVLHFMKHGCEAPNEIAEDTALAVRQLIDGYLEPHAGKIYRHLAAHPALPGAIKIAKWIRERKVQTFTISHVRRCRWREFAKDRDDKAIMAAIELLDALGWVRLKEKPATFRGGRPTLEAVVRPEAWGG